MKIIADERCIEYGNMNHPENPERLRRTYKMLAEKGIETEKAKPCTEEDLLLIHSRSHVESIKTGNFSDPDTPFYENIFEIGCLSAGAALQAMRYAAEGKKAISLMRPPGHHASREKPAGFCYFNNVAIAVEKAIKEGKAKKIAIIDVDGHHGDGTQNIFRGREDVLVVSLHEFPAYPGTGLKSEGNLINFPLAAGTQGEEYMKKLHEGLEKVKELNPDIVAVSAGFDTYKEDPLLQIELDIPDYKTIAERIFALENPTFVILEGGYSDRLPECIMSFMQGIE